MSEFDSADRSAAGDGGWSTYLGSEPVGRCGRCHRVTWSLDDIGSEDRLTQPDGGPCGGTFLAAS